MYGYVYYIMHMYVELKVSLCCVTQVFYLTPSGDLQHEFSSFERVLQVRSLIDVRTCMQKLTLSHQYCCYGSM